MSAPETVGVLLMAYGAATSLEEIPAYLQDILGQRPVTPELIKDVTERYRAIGGRSPLIEITRAQALALEKRLNEGGKSSRFKVFVGMRHSAPTIRSAVEEAAAAGVRTVVALPLTPYHSRMSVGAYRVKLERAVAETGSRLGIVAAPSWHDNPRLISAFAAKVAAALRSVPEPLRASTTVILSAHSLPRRILAEGDPYAGQLEATASAVARAAGLESWRFCYQSRGASAAEAWLGPDVGEIIQELADKGAKGVVVAPIGFISDHLETLYDDDVLYRKQALARGLHFARAEALNGDPGLIAALADVVVQSLAAA